MADSAQPQSASWQGALVGDGTDPPPRPVWPVAYGVGPRGGSDDRGAFPPAAQRQENKQGQTDPYEGGHEDERHRLCRGHDRSRREGAWRSSGRLGDE